MGIVSQRAEFLFFDPKHAENKGNKGNPSTEPDRRKCSGGCGLRDLSR